MAVERGKPNFLVILVDEERYPPVYETPAIQEWSARNLVAQQLLRRHALEFHRHYIGSAACCPSRATLLTGQYPSLHGVSQTPGLAKRSSDPDMFWLDANTVPTMGDYFRAAGYRTYYRGKWHVSNEDILIPGTHNSVASYNAVTGVPDRAKEQLYARADRLNRFGFAGWIGPEPTGRNPRNSGSSAAIGLSGRDEIYGAEAVRLIEDLDRERKAGGHPEPWLVVASFVNPHDIVLYGDLTAQLPALFRFQIDPSIPDIPPPPTLDESLATKPRCQASYRDIYPLAAQPIQNQSFYRRLYYQLQRNADRQMTAVFQALTRSCFYEDTIVIFTSDHGDFLGAHGSLHQKWYCAYEEALHVPFLIHNPRMFPKPQQAYGLTSHLDLLPTMLGLANADIEAIRQRLQQDFSEAKPLVGRNLAPFIGGGHPPVIPDNPVYFMTEDNVTQGLHQVSALGQPYPAVMQPNSVETVLTTIAGGRQQQLWKLSRYYDNSASPHANQTIPAPDEYELYNMTEDPLEIRNLAHVSGATPYTRAVQMRMMQLLAEQRQQKRLTPGAHAT